MKPIDFYVLPRKDALHIAPILPSFLANWEAARPGVLDDIDIFLPNSRTFKHPVTRYDLFRRVETVDPGVVIVVENWLELLLADGSLVGIEKLMWEIRKRYRSNPIVWSWNHDADEATTPWFQCLPENEFCLSYNTSRPSPQDICLPFWNVDCRMTWNPHDSRPLRGGFIGHVGSVEVRQKMRYGFAGRRGWEIMSTEREGKLSQDEYLRRMMQWDFALCPRGGGLSSYRFYEALQCGCIPILFSDAISSGTKDFALPYPDLPWDEFILHIPEEWASSFDTVMGVINHSGEGDVPVKEWRSRIAGVRERFGLAGVQQAIHQRISDYLS